MNDKYSLIDLGKFAEPATVLVDRISDAVGGVFKPWQIRRVAQAEADAELIKAKADIEITELQQRAMARFFAEEAKKQSNIEDITRKALEDVDENAKPQDMEDDWISNFFDKCRLISDEEMQSLWAKVLAGEANTPGKYSKRTVNLLSSIDKSDAILFTKLCGFGWLIGEVIPIIYDAHDNIYKSQGIHFDSLMHLDEIGLLTFEPVAEISKTNFQEVIKVFYYGNPINIKFKNPDKNELKIGRVLLSKTGKELASISGSKPVKGFLEYIVTYWSKKGLVVYSDWPKK